MDKGFKMEIKHHQIFQVYLPKNIGENNDLVSMVLEEAHIMFNGEYTPDFEPNDHERKPLDVVLFPSFVYAAQKMKNSEAELSEEINTRIDFEFTRMLLWSNPIYRLTEFVGYHYTKCKLDKELFLKHIEYIILPLVKRIIENPNPGVMGNQSFEFQLVEKLINEWLEERYAEINHKKNMIPDNKFTTKIEKAENVIINNNSKIDNQRNTSLSKNKKTHLQIVGVIISILMLIITLVVNWNEIFN